MPQRPFYLKISGPNGEQRELPRGTLISVNYDDEQDGGLTGCSIETAVDITALPTVKNGDIIQVIVRNDGEGNRKELRYYGKIVRRALSEEDGYSLSLTGEGESSEIGRIMINREALVPGPPDVSTLWREFAEEARRKRPDLLIASSPVGLKKSEYPANYKKFGDVTRDLIQFAGNRAGWGLRRLPLAPYSPVLSFDRCAQPGDPITSGYTIALPAKAVSSSDGEADATDIRNILFLSGGVPVNPNRVPNSDFRLLEFAGENFRNLIKNPSFDDLIDGNYDQYDAEHWGINNGAAKKRSGLSEGLSHSGDALIELDHENELVVQGINDFDAYIIAGHTYRVSIWARRESGSGSDTKLRIEFYWRDNSFAELSGQAVIFDIPDAEWKQYYFDILCPADGLARGARVSFVNHSGGGIVIDDASVADTSLVLPRFHELRMFGSASQVTFNPVQSAIRHPFRSSYAPELALRTSDSDGNDAHFGLRNNYDGGEIITFDVSGNASYRAMIDLISPTTPNGGTYKNGKFFLEVNWYKDDGTASGSPAKFTINAGAGFTEWYQFAFLASAPSDAVKGSIWLTFRGGCSYSDDDLIALNIPSSERGISRIIVGGMCLRLSGSQPEELPARYVGQPALPGVQYEYIPDGPYQTVIRATDVMAVGSPEYNSITQYGEHPTFEQQDSITTQEEAVFFSQAIFSAYATEQQNGSIALEGDRRQFKACEGIRLRGKRGRALSSSIVAIQKASFRYDGSFQTSLSWGIDRSDPYQVLASFFEQRGKTGGTGAGNGYYGSSGATAGGNVYSGVGNTTPQYWGTGPRTPTDPVLHDDYAPDDGPHVKASERANWNATFTEVTDARASAYTGTAYDSLDERLEALEAVADAGGGGFTGTEGSVPFVGSGGTLTEDNGNLFYDATNKFLGIGGIPTYPLDVYGQSIRLTSPYNNAAFRWINSGAGTNQKNWTMESDVTSSMLVFRTVNDAGNTPLIDVLKLFRDGTASVYGDFTAGGWIRANGGYKSSSGTFGADTTFAGMTVQSGLITGGTFALPANSATDAAIGTRTLDDTTGPIGNSAAQLLTHLSRLANRIKAITGESNWYSAPAMTIAAIVTALAGKAATSHVHGAGDITSGTLDAAWLPDATTGAKGAVRLAGDLAGTAASPVVVGVQGLPYLNAAYSDGEAPVWNDANSRFEPASVGAGAVGMPMLRHIVAATPHVLDPTALTGHDGGGPVNEIEYFEVGVNGVDLVYTHDDAYGVYAGKTYIVVCLEGTCTITGVSYYNAPSRDGVIKLRKMQKVTLKIVDNGDLYVCSDGDKGMGTLRHDTNTTETLPSPDYGVREYDVNINTTSGDVTLTLPPISACYDGNGVFDVVLSLRRNGGNTATVTAASGETINGASSFTLSTDQQVVRLKAWDYFRWEVR